MYLPYRPPSVRPPFAALVRIQAPLSTPVVYLFFFTFFLRHFSNHSLPLPASNVGPVPSGIKGGCASCPGLLTSSTVLPIHSLLCLTVSYCLLGVLIFVYVPFCAFLRGLGLLNSLAVSRLRPHPSAAWFFRRRSDSQSPPPPIPLCPLYTIPVSLFWSGALERNGESCCHGWGCLVSPPVDLTYFSCFGVTVFSSTSPNFLTGILLRSPTMGGVVFVFPKKDEAKRFPKSSFPLLLMRLACTR